MPTCFWCGDACVQPQVQFAAVSPIFMLGVSLCDPCGEERIAKQQSAQRKRDLTANIAPLNGGPRRA